MKRLNTIPVLFAFLLSACGNTQAIFRTTNRLGPDPNGPVIQTQDLIMDAKQRAIITSPPRRDDPNQVAITCAEPSPDALSAVSAALAGSGGFSLFGGGQSQATAALSGAVTEAAKQINRDAIVQLLRDGLYRACEAYMNGAMTREEYGSLSRRYADLTVSLVALEQMGGKNQIPSEVVVNPTASAQANTPPNGGSQQTTEEPGTEGSKPPPQGPTNGGGASAHSEGSGKTGTTINITMGDAVGKDTAEAMEKVVESYYTHTIGDPKVTNQNKYDMLSRCMGYFDRNPSSLNEQLNSEYFIRKGMLIYLCADYLPKRVQKVLENDAVTTESLEGLGELMATGLKNARDNLAAQDRGLQLQKSQNIQ